LRRLLSAHALTELAFVALLLIAIGYQSWWGVFRSSLACHADEPAHFITGMMVFDYVRSALGTNPISFAESYYLHYPKVAFGHWPPVFYIVQTGWYALAGESVNSAYLLMALTTALTAFCIYKRCSETYGKGLALLIGIFFLTLPLAQSAITTFMADMLLTLFASLAVISFGRFLQTERFRYSVTFGIWSSVAILTKGNGLFLALFPLLAVVTTGRYRVLKSWKFWASPVIVLIFCAPFYAFAMKMSLNTGGNDDSSSFRYFGMNLNVILDQCIHAIGIGLALLSIIGASSVRWIKTNEQSKSAIGFVCQLAIAWVLSVFLFLIISPFGGGEERMWLPAMPGIMLLVAQAFYAADFLLPLRWRWTSLPLAAGLLLALAFLNTDRVPQPVSGFASVAQEVSKIPNSQVILISSDSIGEGAFIVEQRLCDKDRPHFVLRSSKVLANDSWSGKDYQLRFHTEEEVRNYLNQVPVNLIVLDNPKCRGQKPDPHQELLARTLKKWPEEFFLLESFPVRLGQDIRQNGILLYENRRAEGRHLEVIKADLSRMLGRQIGLKFTPTK
jgi:hypothetical protein